MAEKNAQTMDMLKDFLSRDDAADKISSILGALGGGPSQEKNSGMPDMSAIAGLLGDGNSKDNGSDSTMQLATIMRLKTAYDSISQQDDPKLKLLEALRPYLQPERIGNLDSAIKMLRLAKLAPLLGELKDLF